MLTHPIVFIGRANKRTILIVLVFLESRHIVHRAPLQPAWLNAPHINNTMCGIKVAAKLEQEGGGVG